MNACKTMVCVTVQKTCERLIRAGSRYSQGVPHALSVVHVAPMNANFLGSERETDALDYLFRISREYGADMDVLRSDRPVVTLAEHARKIGAKCVVLGAPGDPERADFVTELKARLSDVMIHIVPSDDALA